MQNDKIVGYYEPQISESDLAWNRRALKYAETQLIYKPPLSLKEKITRAFLLWKETILRIIVKTR